MIHVDAFSEKSFLIIRFENYYEGEIRFERGLPVTSKKETESARIRTEKSSLYCP